jgi:ABC-type Fe3+/spermidine/putrescine transport system ATPase subunit
MSIPAISIQNFTKRYGKVTAVDNLSFDVPKGSPKNNPSRMIAIMPV